MGSPTVDTCSGPECTDEVHAAGLCRGHYAQKQEGRTLAPKRAIPEDPRRALINAALDLAEADSEDHADYQRKERTLIRRAQSLRHESRPRIPESVRAAVIKARKRGASIRAIAARYGVNVERVWSLCRRG
jgi:DNA-directed RNA polymerase specialized sigma24 family protein